MGGSVDPRYGLYLFVIVWMSLGDIYYLGSATFIALMNRRVCLLEISRSTAVIQAILEINWEHVVLISRI